MKHDRTQLAAKLVGSPDDGGSVRLDEFVSLCSSLRQTLKAVERCITGKEPKLEYLVSDLKQESALIALSAALHEKKASLADQALRVTSSAIDDLQQGRDVDPRIDDEALVKLRRLYKPLEKSAASLTVGDTVITHQYLETIDRLLCVKHVSEGTVSGKLETLDLHGRSSFAIYPPIGGHKIVCTYDDNDEMLPRLTKALERTVTVFGTKFFKKRSAFPSRVHMDSFEVHPPNEELPLLSRLRGVLADEGGPDSTDEIRAIRDDW